jgi:hypothetical protein
MRSVGGPKIHGFERRVVARADPVSEAGETPSVFRRVWAKAARDIHADASGVEHRRNLHERGLVYEVDAGDTAARDLIGE